MKKAWNAMKEKRFDRRTKKLEKQALRYMQKNEKLERHIAESQGDKITKTIVPKKKKENENKKKRVYNEPPVGLDKGKSSQSDEKSEEHTDKELNDDTRELEEDEKIIIQLQNKKPSKWSRKRCHFCRKRGHLQKDCLSKKMLQKWLWNDASKKVNEHPAEMQCGGYPAREA